jgi:DNA invertase Pin-like site-specific DNA recombinase
MRDAQLGYTPSMPADLPRRSPTIVNPADPAPTRRPNDFPAGELIASVMAAVAQWERWAIGARTKEVLAVKRAQGVRLGRPPQLPRKVVKRILKERNAGRTWAAIGTGLDADGVATAQGGKQWYPATVRSVYHSNTAMAA